MDVVVQLLIGAPGRWATTGVNRLEAPGVPIQPRTTSFGTLFKISEAIVQYKIYTSGTFRALLLVFPSLLHKGKQRL